MTCRNILAGCLTLLFAGCAKPPASKSADSVTAAAPAPGTPIVLTLADYSIAAPATLPAGFTTFKTVNTGKELHQAGLVRLDSGKTYSDFQNAMKTSAPPPRWIVWLGGPQNASEVTVPLTAGHYVWMCMIPGPDGVPHIAKGMSAPMTVTASSAPPAAPPTADIDVTVSDYKWDMSTPITAGHHVLKITNTAAQPHEMVLVQLPAGKSAADVARWVDKQVGPPPVLSMDGITALSQGDVNYLTKDFTPGHYALLCFIPDAKDGKPHVAHGMIQDFTVQ
jgi:hypothetical protein